MRRVGGYAQQSLIASRIAEQMQAQAVAYIKDQFEFEDETHFDITNMSLDDLVSAVEDATQNGTLDQLNRQLGAQIAQIILSARSQQ